MRAKTYTSKVDAMIAVAELLRHHLPLIPGLRYGADSKIADLFQAAKEGRDWFGIEWERSFAVGVSLNIALRPGLIDRADGHMLYHQRPVVEVSWSGTSRSPAESMAAIALYQQVAQLACLVEAALARMNIAEVGERIAK